MNSLKTKQGFSRIMTRPADQVRRLPKSGGSNGVGSMRCLKHHGLGRVGSGRVGSGRVGSGRVGSGRVGSGQEVFKSRGSGRVTLTRPDP